MVWSDYSGFLCPHKVELAQPRRLLNAERRWRVILNDGHNFQQTVRLETCLKVSGQSQKTQNTTAHPVITAPHRYT